MEAIRAKQQTDQHLSHCIWMQAGVVRHKFCKHEFMCEACHFDRTMQRVADDNKRLRAKGQAPKGKRGEIVLWREKLKELPAWKRPCLHFMKDRIEFKACTNEYSCGNCDFDQFFDDQYTVHAVVKPVDLLNIEGIKIPQGFYLHRGHCWVKLEEGNTVRVGLDDFAHRMLGPLDHIDTPLLGQETKQDRGDVTLRRGRLKAQLLSPISGVVTAVNPKLRQQASLANEDPYTQGWLFRAHSESLRHEIKHLMISNETIDFLEEEVHGLYREIENVAGPLAADGGYLSNDIYGNLPGIDWRRLTRLFLRT